jgi:hypothetical protein
MNAIAVHPLVLAGYGLVEAPYEKTVAGLDGLARGDQSRLSAVGRTTNAAEALEHLSRLTVPATQLIVVDRGEWTAILTNHRGGSDFNDYQHLASSALGVRSIRVVDAAARWWRRDGLRERLGYEARIFEMHDADGSTIRSIACADDGGRWVFETYGHPLPIEASFAYDAARKKDRFTRENLRDLLVSIGPGLVTAEGLLAAPRFALLVDRITDRAWRERVEAAACSYSDEDDPAFGYYRRGMTWVPHMATHATSVIADFERAVQINPSYEPRVRRYLREAHRIAGN